MPLTVVAINTASKCFYLNTADCNHITHVLALKRIEADNCLFTNAKHLINGDYLFQFLSRLQYLFLLLLFSLKCNFKIVKYLMIPQQLNIQLHFCYRDPKRRLSAPFSQRIETKAGTQMNDNLHTTSNTSTSHQQSHRMQIRRIFFMTSKVVQGNGKFNPDSSPLLSLFVTYFFLFSCFRKQ